MPALQASEEPPAEPPIAEGRKLKPSAVPIWFLYDVGKGIFGVVPIFFAGRAAIPFVIAIGLVLLISPAIKYSRFRYDIQGNNLIVQGGLLGRWRRVIPRERVQSIDVVQKLRHRAFGVIELRIEAVGGKQTEAALVALAPEEAERIRSWASGGKEELIETPPEEPPALARLSGKDLLIAGITGGRVAVLAALIGYSQEYLGENTFDAVTGYAERLLPGASLVVIVSVIAAIVIALSLLLSIALTILIYWDFTVRLEEDRLVITRGLLEKRRAQIPLRRVQAIQVNENFIRRPFGLASLSVVVAGYSSEGSENQESTVLLPLAPTERGLAYCYRDTRCLSRARHCRTEDLTGPISVPEGDRPDVDRIDRRSYRATLHRKVRRFAVRPGPAVLVDGMAVVALQRLRPRPRLRTGARRDLRSEDLPGSRGQHPAPSTHVVVLPA